MTNLTEKLDEVQLQMSTEHTAKMNALTAILNGLVNPDDGEAFLLTLIGSIFNLRQEVGAMAADVELIRLAVTNLQTIQTNAYNTLVSANAKLTDVETWTEKTSQALGTAPTLYDYTVLDWLETINSAVSGVWQSVGISRDGSSDNLLRYSWQQSQCGCKTSDDGRIGGCQIPLHNTYAQNGTIPDDTDPLHATVIQWPLPINITGLTLTSPPIFNWDKSNVELTATNWTLISIYVESEAPYFKDNPNNDLLLPTNQWVTLAGTGSKSFYVPEGYAAQATLCDAANRMPEPQPPAGDYCLNLRAHFNGPSEGTPYNPDHSYDLYPVVLYPGELMTIYYDGIAQPDPMVPGIDGYFFIPSGLTITSFSVGWAPDTGVPGLRRYKVCSDDPAFIPAL